MTKSSMINRLLPKFLPQNANVGIYGGKVTLSSSNNASGTGTDTQHTPTAPSFWKTALRAPKSTGAIIASSPALAQAMVAAIPAREGLVLEFGPGTGAISRALLEKFGPQNILAIEFDAGFCTYLSQHLPELPLVQGDAAALGSAFAAVGFIKPPALRAICSSLPLRNFNRALQAAILREAFTYLPPDGVMVQFCYGAKLAVEKGLLAELGLVAKEVDFVWRNLPPASIWHISRA